MSERLTSYRNHETRDLAWAFQGPGLLNPDCFNGRCLTDTDLCALIEPHLEQIAKLNADSAPLVDFLAKRPTGGRLGRYFENLFLYFFTDLKCVSQIESNLQIRDGKKTIGELDFVYRTTSTCQPIHLEISVKFYICIGLSEAESRDCRFFVGTLIEDRLDRKIDKIFNQQVRLPEAAATCERLEALQMAAPRSQGLMKGCFFYPSSSDWKNHPHPAEVSQNHHRGWWTTAEAPLIPRKSEHSHYIVLPFDRWLTPIYGTSRPYSLYTYSELLAYVARAFDNSWARPLHFELGIAEVEVISADDVREISRGNILHAKWPAHARSV